MKLRSALLGIVLVALGCEDLGAPPPTAVLPAARDDRAPGLVLDATLASPSAPCPSVGPSAIVVPGCWSPPPDRPSPGASPSASGRPSPPAASPSVPAASPSVPGASPPGEPSAEPSREPVAPPPPVEGVTCPASGRVSLVGAPRGETGLPRRGMLAIGSRLADAPLLRGVTPRLLPEPEADLNGEQYAIYELGDVTACVLAFPEWARPGEIPLPKTPVLIGGVRITAPGGLTTEQARAWIAAIAPCTRLDGAPPAAGQWGPLPEGNGLPVNPRLNAERLEVSAFRIADDHWDLLSRTMFYWRYDQLGGPDPRASDLPSSGEVPADRWAGVQGWAPGWGAGF